MKKLNVLMIIAVLLVAMTSSQNVFAQKNSEKRAARAEKVANKIAKLEKELDLNSKQVVSTKKIYNTYEKKRRTIKKENKGNKVAKKAALKVAKKERKKAFKAILTPKQKEKYKAIKKAKKAKKKENKEKTIEIKN